MKTAILTQKKYFHYSSNWRQAAVVAAADLCITQIKTWLLPISLGLQCLGSFSNNWVCWGRKKQAKESHFPNFVNQQITVCPPNHSETSRIL